MAGIRYNPTTEVYRDCRWCRGRGCLSCPAEAKRDYLATFGDGPPQPIARFSLSDMATNPKIKEALGAEAVKQALSEDGGGIQEIVDNCKKAGIHPQTKS